RLLQEGDDAEPLDGFLDLCPMAGRVGAVVEDGQLDLAAVDPTILVDVLHPQLCALDEAKRRAGGGSAIGPDAGHEDGRLRQRPRGGPAHSSYRPRRQPTVAQSVPTRRQWLSRGCRECRPGRPVYRTRQPSAPTRSRPPSGAQAPAVRSRCSTYASTASRPPKCDAPGPHLISG